MLFFYNDTAPTAIYTLSLHDALPISADRQHPRRAAAWSRRAGLTPSVATSPGRSRARRAAPRSRPDRKSTRLNSSHLGISYAVFCLKKKKKIERETTL